MVESLEDLLVGRGAAGRADPVPLAGSGIVPRISELSSGDVDVWSAVLDRPSEEVGRFRCLLSADEQRRASRFHFDRDRSRFTVARGFLRMILGRYVEVDPRALEFRYGAHGKPSLAGASEHVGLEFNLSHSGNLAVCAISGGRSIGVDVECIRALPDAAGIAERFFSPRENETFRRLPESEKLLSFYRCWTRKEAFVKAIGEGLTWPLEQFDVTLAPKEPARLLRVGASAEEAKRWTLQELDLGEGYVGALVVEGKGLCMRCWEC